MPVSTLLVSILDSTDWLYLLDGPMLAMLSRSLLARIVGLHDVTRVSLLW